MSRWAASLGLRPQTAVERRRGARQRCAREPYDLAVIDVMMPGHDGLWLAGELRRSIRTPPSIIATAYTELLGGEASQPPVADLLVKPFQRERFVLAVDRGRQWRKQALEEVHWHARALDRAARSRRSRSRTLRRRPRRRRARPRSRR